MADWPQINEAVRRARSASVDNGLTSRHDQLAAKLRDNFDALGVCLADPDVLYVVLVAWRLQAAYQEQTPLFPFATSAHVFGALASIVPEQVLTP